MHEQGKNERFQALAAVMAFDTQDKAIHAYVYSFFVPTSPFFKLFINFENHLRPAGALSQLTPFKTSQNHPTIAKSTQKRQNILFVIGTKDHNPPPKSFHRIRKFSHFSAIYIPVSAPQE